MLINRGDNRVSQALARNTGARFSDGGYAALVERCERDDELASSLGIRTDIPVEMLRRLISKATEAVREKLLAASPPQCAARYSPAINAIAEQIGVKPFKAVDYTRAQMPFSH